VNYFSLQLVFATLGQRTRPRRCQLFYAKVELSGPQAIFHLSVLLCILVSARPSDRRPVRGYRTPKLSSRSSNLIDWDFADIDGDVVTLNEPER
jgi:hypothetical protein